MLRSMYRVGLVGLMLAAPVVGAAEPLAWLRFSEGQEYAGHRYRWTGDGELHYRIDVKPSPDHVLDLLWGAKNDQRGAELVIQGRSHSTLLAGGYDGFRWQRLTDLGGDGEEAYDILLKPAPPRGGFIAALRLTRADHELQTPLPEGVASHGMRVLDPHAEWPTLEEYAAMPRLERYAAQANRALVQCGRFVDGWLARADPATGLIPRNLNRSRDFWNAHDSAADNYAFMVLTTALIDRDRYQGRMLDMLRTEQRLTSRLDQLPDPYSFSKQGFLQDQPDLNRMIFGGSEYVKDGLMPITEWLGPTPWSQRMLGILDSIIDHAPETTPLGPIPSKNVEVNGELLQMLGRVYAMTGNPVYLEMGVRLGDYYLLGDRHPTRDMDRLRLDDHSCELVSGLTEMYFAVHHAAPDKARAWREPLHAMLDRILEVSLNEDGLMVDTINPKTGQVIKAALTDNWGYNLNGFYTVYQLDGVERYRDAVLRALAALRLVKYQQYPWEGWGSDGIADAVEGALNLYNREAVDGVESWIDTNIDRMLRIQKPDGIVEGWHGDGNFARTAILFALWKQQGVTLQPWCADVQLGAVKTADGIELLLRADQAWRGRLVFDMPRHRTILNLAADYPRINQIPEWFTVEADAGYAWTMDGMTRMKKGHALAAGLEIELLPGQDQRIQVRGPVSPGT